MKRLSVGQNSNIDDLVETEMSGLKRLGLMHESAVRAALKNVARRAQLGGSVDGKGPWMQIFSHRAFYPFAPDLNDINIQDIAHALSCICRFGGHCSEFYSVAQHSVSVSLILEALDGKLAASYGLLHDASEAYIGDVPRPLKISSHYAFYRDVESSIQDLIYRRFALSPSTVPELLRYADNLMLATEKRDLMDPEASPWEGLPATAQDKIEPMSPREAENAFLARANYLWR